MEKRERPLVASPTNGPDLFDGSDEYAGCDVIETNAFITSTIQASGPGDKATKKVSIKCAGRCMDNPGGIGVWSFIVFDSAGGTVHQAYGDIGYGEGVTNNVAAYHAIIEALDWLVNHFEKFDADILSDSQLAVNQINGDWSCKKAHLKKMNDEIYELRCMGRLTEIRWIPLKENGGADALCQLAYRQASRKYNGGGND